MAVIWDTTKNDYAANEYFQQVSEAVNDLANESSSLQNVEQSLARSNRPDIRTPWTMTTVQNQKEGGQGMQWYCNPSDVTWNLPQRTTVAKTNSGTVLHVWRNTARNTFYDEPRISINFQSGNIIPVKDGNSKVRAGGMSNFYQFMQLVDSPKITDDGRANYVIIGYRSNLFPSLTVQGWFDPSGLKFTDGSDNPNQVNSWSAEFIVLETIPKLSNSQLYTLANSQLTRVYDNELKKIKDWS